VHSRYPNAPPITLVQLATHTSGLGREPDNTETYLSGAVADWEKTLLAALPHTHYTNEPGTRFSYSNIGYAMLGAALSRAAGESYLDYIPKHIFQLLGMSHSALEWNSEMQPHLAEGYQVSGPNSVDSETAQRENQTGRGYKVPNGAIYTTVGDLARFVSFLLGLGPEAVLKTASLERFQKQVAVPADVGLPSEYGIGFQVDRRDGYVAFGHDGCSGLHGDATDQSAERSRSRGILERSGESGRHRRPGAGHLVEVSGRTRCDSADGAELKIKPPNGPLPAARS